MQTEWRTIRVFVSSTFRDMQAEREELVKRIFPQLRKMCEKRGVTWGEVDLRWGITDEQKAEGKVLPICLEEIKRCRPFFIGLLGERYGWVPNEVSKELSEHERWLEKHHGKSVTELEILHGVLNNPDMANRACFYFRDPAYVEKIPSEQRAEFTESEPPACRKLAALKESIRASGLPVRENYPDPQALGQLVLEDLTTAINQEFPPETVPEPLDREAAEHESFAQSRAGVYIGRKEYFDRLDSHVAGDGRPLVILGESGCGKSALLANWALRYRRSHPDELLIMHFIGASPYSADWAGMVRRIMGELKRRFDIQMDIPDKPDELRSAFANWLNMAAARGRIILILDALNQLEDRDGAADLIWLPAVIPANVRLIVSTLAGRPLEELNKRDWPAVKVNLLEAQERKQLIKEYLDQYRKSLSQEQVDRISAAEQTANPLYLRALLEELRLFGVQEKLDERIGHYLAAGMIPQLYEKILQRYEQDYERERPALVKDTMSLIWASRRGLSESELLEMLGEEGKPLPRAYFSPLYLAAEQSLVSRSGLISFFHNYLREAVRCRYLPTEQDKRSAHLRLAMYYDDQNIGPRKLDELPWQLVGAQEFELVKEWLTYRSVFLQMYEENRYELLQYWLNIADHYDMVEAYEKELPKWENQVADPQEHVLSVWLLAKFFLLAGRYAAAETLLRHVLQQMKTAMEPDHLILAACLNDVGMILKTKRDFAEAEKMYREALEIFEKQLGEQHPTTATCICNLGLLLEVEGKLGEAEQLLRRALRIEQQVLGKEDPRTANTLNVLAGLMRTKRQYKEGESLYHEAIAVSRKVNGPRHPRTLTYLSNLGSLYSMQGSVDAAENIHRDVLSVREQVLGPSHPETGVSLINFADILVKKGELDKAEACFTRAFSIWKAEGGRRHPNCAIALCGLAEIHGRRGQTTEAEKLFREGLKMFEDILGADNPELLPGLVSFRVFLEDQGRQAEAEVLQKRIVEISAKAFGRDSESYQEALVKLIDILCIQGKNKEAKCLIKEHSDTLSEWLRQIQSRQNFQ